MFSIIYQFYVKEGFEDTFIEGWKGLTQLIYEHEGSFGSRLHVSDKGEYIAYAQWPSEEIFNNSGSKLPERASLYRKLMRESCHGTKVLHKLNTIEDLIEQKPFKQ